MLCRHILTVRPRFPSLILRRAGHGYPGGIPGTNLPFSLHSAIPKFTIMFIVFFGSGLGAPFLVLRHQLTKK